MHAWQTGAFARKACIGEAWRLQHLSVKCSFSCGTCSQDFVTKGVNGPVQLSSQDSESVSLADLVQTAEYLQLQGMMDLVLAKLATMIKGHSSEEINTAFGIGDSVNKEDLAKVYIENPWLVAP